LKKSELNQSKRKGEKERAFKKEVLKKAELPKGEVQKRAKCGERRSKTTHRISGKRHKKNTANDVS